MRVQTMLQNDWNHAYDGPEPCPTCDDPAKPSYNSLRTALWHANREVKLAALHAVGAEHARLMERAHINDELLRRAGMK